MRVYEARQRGKDHCNTDGSDHYRQGAVEPIELIMSAESKVTPGEGFCTGNVIKYSYRYLTTGNKNDLIKAADYLHIVLGYQNRE